MNLMTPTLPNSPIGTGHTNLDVRLRMAKVHGAAHEEGTSRSVRAKVHSVARKKIAISEYRAAVGLCIERARCLSGLTADQFAAELDCHPTQLSKWIRNVEPPQIDRVLMSPMRGFMLQALAERTPGCEVESVIRMRRSA